MDRILTRAVFLRGFFISKMGIRHLQLGEQFVHPAGGRRARTSNLDSIQQACVGCHRRPVDKDDYPDTQAGARNPTGPDAMHNDSAVVLARTVIASPAPGSRAKTRLSPGCTGTLTAGPCDSDSVIEPSLLAR